LTLLLETVAVKFLATHWKYATGTLEGDDLQHSYVRKSRLDAGKTECNCLENITV